METSGRPWPRLRSGIASVPITELSVCNWLVPAGSAETLCAACRHNQIIPDLQSQENLVAWRKVEAAKKHRVFYSLKRLRLPWKTGRSDPQRGLVFNFPKLPLPVILPMVPRPRRNPSRPATKTA